jgi:Na+-transporting NADH:ubiquinone oxidoreductase subunit NqrF
MNFQNLTKKFQNFEWHMSWLKSGDQKSWRKIFKTCKHVKELLW